LLAVGLRQDRAQGREADGRRRRARRRRRGQGGGSRRFCMGAAWREPKDRDMDALCRMVAGVKAMGLETCMTLGMLTRDQADRLKRRRPRLLQPQYRHLARALWRDHHHPHLPGAARHAGGGARVRHGVCCGGIVGMGESREDRVGFLHALATLPAHPESVPINALVPVKGTVLGDMLAGRRWRIDDIEFVRTVAVARITMPRSMVRLSAGRESMSESDAGALLPGRRQQHLHRRQAADHRQCRRGRGRGAVREAGAGADDERGAGAGGGGMPPNCARCSPLRCSRRS
jgi:hypothetical protein